MQHQHSRRTQRLRTLLISGAMAWACLSPNLAFAQTAAPPSLKVECDLKQSANGYAGTCVVPCLVNALAVDFNGPNRSECAGMPRTVNATLARTTVPNRWLGTMIGVQPEDPTRLEVVPDKTGNGSVARMPYGWFRVTELRTTTDGMRLEVDANRQVRPNADDLAIIDRATALLPNAEGWNKDDTRMCPPGQKKLSLFCALMQATTEVSGGVHYRQPAMQAVREELNLVDKARIKTHRIMDYNNHPDTTLQEIHGLLQRAKARVAAEVRQ
jgi:hypothetical protein